MTPTGTAATATETYLDLMVASHNAEGVRERHELERRARRHAAATGLDEFALEQQVLARVFASMSDAELEAATADPSRKVLARAEQRRRIERADAAEIDPEANAPRVDLSVVCALLNGNVNVPVRAHVESLGGGLACLVVTDTSTDDDGPYRVCIDEAHRVVDTAEQGAARMMGVDLETETAPERSWQIGHAYTSLDAARIAVRALGYGWV
jgi:hypothetical protein